MTLDLTFLTNNFRYLIDNKWFKQWQTYVNYESINNNLIDQSAYPGPIDNSNILKGMLF